jgi:ATP-dependent Clp protease protease subunit
MGGMEGQQTDVEIQAREMLRMKNQINDILAKHTGQPVKKIEQDTDRDNFMTPEDAKKYGLIDKIIL